MNLQALIYFREIVETKSISKVAQQRHISQSALSQTLNKLESEMGHKLLERSNRGVAPTKHGEILFKHAGTMLRVYDKMLEEFSYANREAEVKISGFLSLLDYSLPCILYKVKKKHPHLQFNLHVKNNISAANDLYDHLSDIAFLTEKIEDERLKINYLGKEKMVLVAHSSFRIPDKITLKQLLSYDMVLVDDDSVNLTKIMASCLNDIGESIDSLSILFKVDSIPGAKSTLNNALGICFLPYMSVKKEIYEKTFKAIEVSHFEFDYPIYLATLKEPFKSKSVETVYEYFLQKGSKEFC